MTDGVRVDRDDDALGRRALRSISEELPEVLWRDIVEQLADNARRAVAGTSEFPQHAIVDVNSLA